jgi:hypothetical protein
MAAIARGQRDAALIEAALAYYRRHKALIDARLLLNAAV